MDNKVTIGYDHFKMTVNTSKRFDCNEITLINQGTQNVTIGAAMVLTPGQAFTYVGRPGEINHGVYDIIFDNQTLPGCLCVAVCKTFMH